MLCGLPSSSKATGAGRAPLSRSRSAGLAPLERCSGARSGDSQADAARAPPGAHAGATPIGTSTEADPVKSRAQPPVWRAADLPPMAPDGGRVAWLHGRAGAVRLGVQPRLQQRNRLAKSPSTISF